VAAVRRGKTRVIFIRYSCSTPGSLSVLGTRSGRRPSGLRCSFFAPAQEGEAYQPSSWQIGQVSLAGLVLHEVQQVRG
jgi:hypothetical protein